MPVLVRERGGHGDQRPEDQAAEDDVLAAEAVADHAGERGRTAA